MLRYTSTYRTMKKRRQRRAMLEVTFFVVAGVAVLFLALAVSMYGAWLGGVDVMNTGFFSADGDTLNQILGRS